MSKIFTFPAFFLDETLVTSICGKILTPTDCIRIDVGSLALIVTRKFGLPATARKKKAAPGLILLEDSETFFFWLLIFFILARSMFASAKGSLYTVSSSLSK